MNDTKFLGVEFLLDPESGIYQLGVRFGRSPLETVDTVKSVPTKKSLTDDDEYRTVWVRWNGTRNAVAEIANVLRDLSGGVSTFTWETPETGEENDER
jgi:hypothetical protein